MQLMRMPPLQHLRLFLPSPSPAEIVAVLDKVKRLYTTINGLGTAPSGVDTEVFLSEIGQRLFDLLLADYLGCRRCLACMRFWRPWMF